MPSTVKHSLINISLPKPLLDDLRQHADEQDLNLSAAARQLIKLGKWVADAQKRGDQIMLRTANGEWSGNVHFEL